MAEMRNVGILIFVAGIISIVISKLLNSYTKELRKLAKFFEKSGLYLVIISAGILLLFN